jgi:hypothetical protein
MNCDVAKNQIPLFLYGELSFDEEESFEAHLEGCPVCRDEVARQTVLHRTLDRIELIPSAALLAKCRRDFAGQVRTGRRNELPSAALPSRLSGVWNHLGIPRLVWQPAAALALLSLGFFGSRLMSPGSYMTAGSDPVASRVKYVEPEGSGKVHLVVEETRQRVLNGRLDDEPIRRLLLAAVKDPSDPGVRVESIDVLKSSSNAREVQRALLNAVLHDSNAGVRLKAIEGLKPYSDEPETRHSLAQVLLNDDNPGVRTQAVDLLMQHRESADVVGILQQLLQKEDNGYIRMRSQKALRDMNASEGTF